jgi:hypothetical protein
MPNTSANQTRRTGVMVGMNGVDYDIPQMKVHMRMPSLKSLTATTRQMSQVVEANGRSQATPREVIACASLLCLLASAAHADPQQRASPQPEDILPQSELDDPIGIDSDSRGLERAAPPPDEPVPKRTLERERERFGPTPPPFAARAGEVLTAPAGVRELAHLVEIELAPGFARVQVAMRFEARGEKPSELRYRLAIPEGGRLSALEVCNDHGCRSGLPADGSGARAYAAALLARPASDARALPIAHAWDQRDGRGAAIVVHAAPVLGSRPLSVRVSYLVPIQLRGGVLRLRLPARGMDPQVAAAELHLSAPELIDARIANAAAGELGASVDPWADVELSARAKSGGGVRSEVLHVACGAAGQRCGFAQAWAGPRASPPVDLVIALDVSPSTEGEARGRLVPVIAGLLSALPEGSRVRALAFAARARPVIEQAMEPARVELAPFERAAVAGELGSATRFEAVWEQSAPWFKSSRHGVLRPVIVIVGDGGLTGGDARPFERARAAGVEVSAVNAADGLTSAALSAGVRRASGIAVHAAAEAEAAARGRDPSALHDALRALFAPTLARSVTVLPGGTQVELGALRAGEQRAWRGLFRGGLRLRAGTATAESRLPARALGLGLAADAAAKPDAIIALAALDARDLRLPDQGWPEPVNGPRCDLRGPARRMSGISSDAQPVALAEERSCRPAIKTQPRSNAEQGRGMPAEPLLSMLRQRILPIARGCFRRDRAGRPIYEKRAVFAFTLADREIAMARVEGVISAALKRCLLAAVDTLEVPRFTGTVTVRYPLVTESLPLPDQIELRAGTAGELDHLFGH